MINHNTLLYQVFDRTIKIDFQNKEWIANYTEGDLSELVKKLEKDSITKYPIIWLQTGYSVERKRQEGTTKLIGCKFFLITLGSKTDRYEKRFSSTYENVLYPLLSKIDKIFSKTKGLIASNEDSYTVFPLNDLANDENGNKLPQLAAIADVWDAVLFETDITITDGCFPELIIK
ncbi:hypothetical protein [Chryseobacterium bernardetii]|uniref:hypothetical protein n=1 Tax=Chryseobacterium bernardetii TaxID=1241978 RepID=UPI001625F7E8|nr:hypothetical protein [Chryseobacterium bernardetii]